MANNRGLTLLELMNKTGSPEYTIVFLRRNGRLPLIQQPTGGRPAIYAWEAVKIVKDHLERNKARRRVNY